MAMRVEIWSDVVCPWCYVGKTRFDRALASFGHRDQVEVVYRSFELDPSVPTGKTTATVDLLATKYRMTVAQAEDAQRQMVETAAHDGLIFRMDGLRSGSTYDAHRLLHLAKEPTGSRSSSSVCIGHISPSRGRSSTTPHLPSRRSRRSRPCGSCSGFWPARPTAMRCAPTRRLPGHWARTACRSS